MDSASIVSFNNDSTYQTTLKADYNNVSVPHELALHAMRDRCLLLQKRINSLENDNMRLKLEVTKSEGSPYVPLEENEKLVLQQKIAELNKQKSQLMHHVFMVSCENKNLWSKLSSFNVTDKQKNVLQTNTYTHSTPKNSANYQEKYSESSLEEISLKLINSYIQEKSQLVEQYEQMAELQYKDSEALNVNSIGFRFVEDPPTDSLKEIHGQTEKLQNMQRELSEQEKHLKLILNRVENVIQNGYKCPSCLSNTRLPSENKEIETSDSLANWATPVESTTHNDIVNEVNNSQCERNISDSFKVSEEVVDRICPMCGTLFQGDVPFSEFQLHVESHFTGDIASDSIIGNTDLSNSFNNV